MKFYHSIISFINYQLKKQKETILTSHATVHVNLKKWSGKKTRQSENIYLNN